MADWNGLDSDYTVREGQILIVPLVDKKVQKKFKKEEIASVTPPPPSSKKPQPRNTAKQEAIESSNTSISVPESGRMAYPIEV